MKIRRKFDGDSTDIHGFSMVRAVGHPPAQRPPARALSRPGRAWNLQDDPGNIPDTLRTTPRNLMTIPGSFRTLSDRPWTFRKKRQTTENDSKMTKVMEIVANELIWLQMV